MKIESEHNGIKFGEKCWAWVDKEHNGHECFFMGYVKGISFPVKVIDEDGHNNGFKNARPLKTEEEKVLAAFEGQNICLEGWNEDTYLIPQLINADGRLNCVRNDGATIYLNVGNFDDWQLWEAPKVVLDTRRVAGMWCACPELTDKARLVECVDIQKGLDLRLTGSNDLDGSDLKDGYIFSKDHRIPLDQWKNLAEICREAQA